MGRSGTPHARPQRRGHRLADGHPDVDRSWRVFTVAGVLARLAEERIAEARTLLLEAAHDAALGRVPYESNAVLIGLAALAHHDGDQRRAIECLSTASEQRFSSLVFLGEYVTTLVDAPQGVVRRPASFQRGVDALDFLRQVLADWPD